MVPEEGQEEAKKKEDEKDEGDAQRATEDKLRLVEKIIAMKRKYQYSGA